VEKWSDGVVLQPVCFITPTLQHSNTPLLLWHPK
jgi:hypothetical protein